MGSSLVKITVHLIFHVKTTSTFVATEDLNRLFEYICGIIRGLDSVPIQVGGVNDHVHIFCTLPKTLSVSEFIKTIKSESSRWIKTIGDKYHTFSWQSGYGAFSVSPSLIKKTINYIQNQEEHHRVKTFHEEYKLFLDTYGIDYDERYTFND